MLSKSSFDLTKVKQKKIYTHKKSSLFFSVWLLNTHLGMKPHQRWRESGRKGEEKERKEKKGHLVHVRKLMFHP